MADIQNERPGTMAAVIGLGPEAVQRLCAEATDVGPVAPANYNTPAQIVVSGDVGAVERVIELASAAGAKRAVRLQVGAAFHSQMMKPVQQELAEEMQSIPWAEPRFPMASNASGKLAVSADEVREALIAQIASPVRWVDCVRTMVGQGCHTFLELGPGRVLGGLVRQVEPGVQVFAADSPAKLDQFAATRV